MNKNGPVRIDKDRWKFYVWAPLVETMFLHIVKPRDERWKMKKDNDGYFSIECENIQPGARYFLQPEGKKDLPDPASSFQPDGVHGHSAVVDHSSFKWSDQMWRGVPLRDLIIYELHIGTFSDAGTFDSAIEHLDHLVEIGVNAIEIMPVSQFPGSRNWGYDGVFLFAVQHSYGGPDGLKRLVDACHARGISVILDVVYNHFGPEGNCLPQFGPYFSKAHHVPWGDALNFDQQWSNGVRDLFIENITHWVENYHIDGLRLDAIHCIYDSNPTHILEEFNTHAKTLREKVGRPFFMIAESDLNDPRVIKHPAAGGYGFDAQWLDDFHHALFVLVDPDGKKRYEDFGTVHQMAKAFSEGFVYSGEYVKFRRRKFGASSAGISGDQFVVFIQNHDQIGNRVKGDRLSGLGKERVMLAAAAIILSPYVPMLFMGEEYGEDAPFTYFVDHSDPKLIEAVREGRKREFADYGDEWEPMDAQDVKTFDACKLRWDTRKKGHHGEILAWYKKLIELRKDHPVFREVEKTCLQTSVIGPSALAVLRHTPDHNQEVYLFFNFSNEPTSYTMHGENWKLLLSSNEKEKTGKPSDVKIELPPLSVMAYERKNIIG